MSGPQEYSACAKYLSQRFEKLNRNADKNIYVHETCATDTNQVQLVMDSVTDSIIQQSLQSYGLM